ncbi:hypothetical protein FNN91_23505 [Salmonella enterica subsp. salamae]|nr:hypothetical protein [Salmonella enterica subsp. salamae]
MNKWSAERKFGFEETVNFQAPRPPANIRPERIEQAGGEPQKFCRPREQKGTPTCRFLWGACPAHRQASRRDQPL